MPSTVWEQTKMAVGWAIPSPDGRYLALWQADGNANVWMVDKLLTTMEQPETIPD